MAVHTSKLQSIALPRAQARALSKRGAIIVLSFAIVFVRGDLGRLDLYPSRYEFAR